MQISKQRTRHVGFLNLFALCMVMIFAVNWQLPNIFEKEDIPYTRHITDNYLKNCGLDKYPELRAPAKMYSLCISYKVFGNVKVMPFLFTLALYPMTFLLARKITGSTTRGTIATILLAPSAIINGLGPTAAFSPDWALYLVSSMYLAYRKPVLSGPVFFLSVAAKGLSLLFAPVILYMVWRSAPRMATLSVGATSATVIILWAVGFASLIQPDGFRWQPEMIQYGLKDMVYVFRNDPLQFVMIPAALASLALCQNPLRGALAAMVVWHYSLVFLLPVFSIYMMYDYRMIPLIIICAISVSTNKILNNQSPKLGLGYVKQLG